MPRSTPNGAPASGVPAHDLIAMIAHDLRTPVTSIKGFSQLALRQYGMSRQVGEYLTTVVAEANRLAAMVDDLVLVSGVEQGIVVPKPATIDVFPFLVAQARATTNEEYPVRVVTNREPFAIQADVFLLDRVFASLIRLALKYCRIGDSVQLSAQRGVHGPAISVATQTTHSTSVDEEVDLASETYHPRGMSNYIATLLIEAQGGTILAEPLGHGIRYQVRLPAAE